MPVLRPHVLLSCALVLSSAPACKSAQTPGPTPAATSLDGEPAPVRWTAPINSVTESTGDLRAASRIRVAGNVEMTPGISGNYTTLKIVFSSPFSGRSMSWALLPNRCGTDEAPVVPAGNYPSLDLSTSGRGEATAQIPFTFPTTGQFHVNVYNNNTTTLAGVVGCANLELRK
jgi:hypothetical protein